jgi:hypothetical protein
VQLSEDEIKSYVKDNLANYKVPRDIVFVDELPRNQTGKVLKRELAEKVEGSSGDGESGDSSESRDGGSDDRGSGGDGSGDGPSGDGGAAEGTATAATGNAESD